MYLWLTSPDARLMTEDDDRDAEVAAKQTVGKVSQLKMTYLARDCVFKFLLLYQWSPAVSKMCICSLNANRFKQSFYRFTLYYSSNGPTEGLCKHQLIQLVKTTGAGP